MIDDVPPRGHCGEHDKSSDDVSKMIAAIGLRYRGDTAHTCIHCGEATYDEQDSTVFCAFNGGRSERGVITAAVDWIRDHDPDRVVVFDAGDWDVIRERARCLSRQHAGAHSVQDQVRGVCRRVALVAFDAAHSRTDAARRADVYRSHGIEFDVPELRSGLVMPGEISNVCQLLQIPVCDRVDVDAVTEYAGEETQCLAALIDADASGLVTVRDTDTVETPA